MKQFSLRAIGLATATAVATSGVVLGVGAWAEQSSPTGSSAVALTSAEAALLHDRKAAAARRDAALAAEKAAAAKAAAEKRAAEKRAAEKAAAEKAAAEKAAAEEAAAEEAVRERSEEQRSSRSSRSGSPRAIAESMAAERGWGGGEFSCLDSLWQKESGWSPTADNPTSSAYGIPQALPGSKMASEGSDWETNPATQIAWGLGYIEATYGSPCSAWEHSQANNWY